MTFKVLAFYCFSCLTSGSVSVNSFFNQWQLHTVSFGAYALLHHSFPPVCLALFHFTGGLWL